MSGIEDMPWFGPIVIIWAVFIGIPAGWTLLWGIQVAIKRWADRP